MNITLKNIGTLKEATFDLDKDLIVFIGPNNTGKTYAAYCLYGLTQIDFDLTNELTDVILDNSNFEELFQNNSIEIDLITLLNKDVVNSLLNIYGRKLKIILPELFAIGKDHFEKAEAKVNFDNVAYLEKFLKEYDFPILGSPQNGCEIYYSKEIGSNIININISNYREEINSKSYICSQIKYHLAYFILWPSGLIGITHFIPVERIGISMFVNDILNNRFAKTNEIIATNNHGKINKLIAYPLAIQNALTSYSKLSRVTQRTSDSKDFEELANELEYKILKGKIANSESGNIEFHDSEKFQLKLQGAGSIVKSLVSLLLYLRYEADSGQVLIIDEPEINLHPDNQRLVARILAKLSKLGVKVIVSTHSDYFIKELNNLIMLNKDHPDTAALREKYGYDETEILDYKKVGTYLFIDNKATELEVTPVGMEAATIDEEINKLNNTATDIYWTLFEN